MSGLPGSFESEERKRTPAFRRARRKSFSGVVSRDFTRAIKDEIRCAREGASNQYFR